MGNPEHIARPARYQGWNGEYTPPSDGYRRPGSDHSHLPHSHDAEERRRMPEATQQQAAGRPSEGAPAGDTDGTTSPGQSMPEDPNDWLHRYHHGAMDGELPPGRAERLPGDYQELVNREAERLRTVYDGIQDVAITHDGRLLLWVDGDMIDIDRPTTAAIRRLLNDNRDRVA